jgi:LemA protein
MIGWVILVIIVAVIGYAIFLYNSLVRNRQLSQEAWSGIDVQLKRRTDLIPNLLAGPFGFSKMEYFELENAADRAVPQVKF